MPSENHNNMLAGPSRKRKTPEEIPDPGDPDRKRMLNVLAQRRYRERQRHRIAALEANQHAQSTLQLASQGGGDVEVLEISDNSPKLTSTASSESSPAGLIEETKANFDDFGFLEMELRLASLDMPLFEDLTLCHLPNANSPATYSQGSSSSAIRPALNFPLGSDTQLQVPILGAMRAFCSIATALNIINVVWDLNYLHVLPSSPAPNLPWNLQPTPAQLTIPHHPIIDALPWPSVREKLICMLSLQSMCRPRVAQEDDPQGSGQANAIQQLTHDLDDLSDTTRVYGNVVGWDACSELVEDAWEMGECFYRNWWFCIDANAVMTTNKWRRKRGVGALKLKG